MENVSEEAAKSTTPATPLKLEGFSTTLLTTTVTAGIVPRTTVAPLSPGTAPQCQPWWRLNEDNNYCYKLIRDPVSWSEADRGCRRLGAHLASVLDDEESRFITHLISDVDNRLVWLGLTREAPSSPDGRWMWTDGSRYSYTNWAPGEPNNGLTADGPMGEQCAGARPRASTGFWEKLLRTAGKNGQWNDRNCQHRHPYICMHINQ
ncbi:C-type lectin lectoxin-Lio2-like [Branchiostoma floridae x Branchiostoma belcheri]